MVTFQGKKASPLDAQVRLFHARAERTRDETDKRRSLLGLPHRPLPRTGSRSRSNVPWKTHVKRWQGPPGLFPQSPQPAHRGAADASGVAVSAHQRREQSALRGRGCAGNCARVTGMKRLLCAQCSLQTLICWRDTPRASDV